MTNTQSPAPGAAEALKELLDGIHAGRFVPLANSTGYCQSLVDNAEEALAVLQASAAAVEPVAWRKPETYAGSGATIGYTITYQARVANLWKSEGYAVEPLYTAPPLPAQVQAAVKPATSIARLVETLRQAAVEIADAGHAGWGNTCTAAADVLESTLPNTSGVTDADVEAATRELQAVGDWTLPPGGVRRALEQFLASRTPAPGMAGGVGVTLEEVEQLAKAMWRGEALPGRVLRFGAAVLGLADAAAPHPAPAQQAAGADNPTNLPESLGETVHEALVGALQARGYRADGDNVALARRAHLMALEDRDLINMQKALIEKLKPSPIEAGRAGS